MKKHCVSTLMIISFILLLIAGCSGTAGDNISNTGRTETDGVDIDLSVLSNIMVQAEVNNIYTNSSDYIGKTIKVTGPYYSQYWQETGLTYHYVMIVEGDACCRLGLEFKIAGNFPQQDTMIEVTGVLGKYTELKSTFIYISADSMTILS